MAASSIKATLLKSFSIAILIPSLAAAAAGVWMIREQVFAQAQAQVTSDLEGAKEIYRNYLERLNDAIRVHATRMAIYGALERNDANSLAPEMERIRRGERLDVLTLTDSGGKVFFRTQNPMLLGDSQCGDEIVRRTIDESAPFAGTEIVPRKELEKESPDLVRSALMEITPTLKAAPMEKSRETSGMMLKAAAPVLTPDGRMIGVLYGAVLLNRNYEIVDKIRQTVFKEGTYKGRMTGTATIFQGDLRISTNVKNEDGTRAITTVASAEVAEAVLHLDRTYLGRAFVVNDWYISAYAPIANIAGKTIGMIYVGTLERPYRDNLWNSLLVFLGITVMGVLLVGWIAVLVAQRISRPVHALAGAAHEVADGDYSQKVAASSTGEIGYLVESFNKMVSQLSLAHLELREWGENLEKKVEERTSELRTVQAYLFQAEKLAAIGKLAAGVAHEINNPLTGILTNSSLMLQDSPAGDPRRQDLQTIVDETLRCRKIVKSLLDFARQTKPQKQALNMNGVVEDVLSLVRNQVSFRNIAIKDDLDPHLPTLMADKDQMQQVVLNIVINAAEAMPEGGELRITSRVDLRAEGMVEVRFADTGPGIPDEVKANIFEPFFTTKKTGTGLGLSIAYGIVERHGGTLRVESAPGRGTTMIILLPASGKNGDDNGLLGAAS